VIGLPELSLCLALPHTSPYSNNALALGLYLTLGLYLWKVTRRRVKRGPWFIYYVKLLEMTVILLLLVCEILHCMFVGFIMVLLNKYAWVLCWMCNLLKYTYLWSMVCSSILPSPLWNIMKSIVVSKDIWLVCQVDLYQFVSPFCQNVKSTFPRFQLYIVNKATLQNCHHPVDCPKWASICPWFKKFWAVKCLIFSDLPKILPPKIRLPLD
jgi:hypothetical protein